MIAKKLYFEFSDGIDVLRITMDLSGCTAWIESDMQQFEKGDTIPNYTLTPVWLTDEEYNSLPEAEI